MIKNLKTEISYVAQKDKDFWFLLDKHISFAEYNKKFAIGKVIYYRLTVKILVCCAIIYFGIILLFVTCFT